MTEPRRIPPRPAPGDATDVVSEVAREHPLSLRASRQATAVVGSPRAVAISVVVAVVWLVAGVLTGFPRAWELVATVGAPFVALLALFVVQHTQNHDDRAVQLKLDELLRALEPADDRIMAVEDADDHGLGRIGDRYRAVAARALEVRDETPGAR